MFTRSGVRTHVDIHPLDLKSNALTTRPSWYLWDEKYPRTEKGVLILTVDIANSGGPLTVSGESTFTKGICSEECFISLDGITKLQVRLWAPMMT